MKYLMISPSWNRICLVDADNVTKAVKIFVAPVSTSEQLASSSRFVYQGVLVIDHREWRVYEKINDDLFYKGTVGECESKEEEE